MLNPAWPKRIVFGHAGATFRNGRQTGIREGKIAEGFWPGTETGENVPRRPLRPRLYERPTDHPAADPRPAGIRRPAGLDSRTAGERCLSGCIATATAGEVAGGGAPPGDRRGAGVALGSLGPISGGPARHTPGTGASRSRLRLPELSPGSDDARRPGDGWIIGRFRRVRAGHSAGTSARRPGPRPAERQAPGPSRSE